MAARPEEAGETGAFRKPRHSTATAAFAQHGGELCGGRRAWRGCLMSSQTHPDQPPDDSAEGTWRPEPSRRSVLYGAAGLAGAGLAASAIAGTLAAPAAASAAAAPRPHPGQAPGVPSPAEPVIVHV